MDPLIAAIPPEVLLKMSQGLQRPSDARRLEDAILCNCSLNKAYRREVMQVWAYHSRHGTAVKPTSDLERLSDSHLTWHAQSLTAVPAPPHDDLSVGPVVAELALRRLETWPVKEAEEATDDVVARLETVLVECSKAATLDRNGDKILHGILKLHLPAALVASIANEPPYEHLNQVHGDRVNDLVNKWLETPFEELADHIDYNSDDPIGLAIAGGLIAEVFDDSPSLIAVNSEVLTRREPALVAFTGFGDEKTPDMLACAHNCTLYKAPHRRPIASVILEWAKRTRKSLLYKALTSPEELPPGSLPRRWLT